MFFVSCILVSLAAQNELLNCLKTITNSVGCTFICRAIKKLVGEARKLWDMHHTNIITMFGLITEGEYSLVMEYTKYGCVLDFVEDYKVPMNIKISIIHDIVLGMNYLHTRDPAVIHCDLKAYNVLISEGYRAKASVLPVYAF